MGTSSREWAMLAVFGTVYLGMFLGGLPRLKIDRSGVALLGAIATLVLLGWSVQEAARVVDLPTLVLLFSFMVLSAQMRLGGFYAAFVRWVGAWALSRAGLLAALVGVSAALSAVCSNGVVCLAFTPVVLRIALCRGMDPVRLLLALACSANIGSVLRLSLARYLQQAVWPVAWPPLGLWAWLVLGQRAAKAAAQTPASHAAPTSSAQRIPPDPSVNNEDPPFDAWQTVKG